jgi:hypothetical protein
MASPPGPPVPGGARPGDRPGPGTSTGGVLWSAPSLSSRPRGRRPVDTRPGRRIVGGGRWRWLVGRSGRDALGGRGLLAVRSSSDPLRRLVVLFARTGGSRPAGIGSPTAGGGLAGLADRSGRGALPGVAAAPAGCVSPATRPVDIRTASPTADVGRLARLGGRPGRGVSLAPRRRRPRGPAGPSVGSSGPEAGDPMDTRTGRPVVGGRPGDGPDRSASAGLASGASPAMRPPDPSRPTFGQLLRTRGR